MIRVYPFAALMPAAEYADQVACRISGGETDEQLRLELEANPFSYLHVVKAGIHFGENPEHRDLHYRFARNYFGQMIEQKVLRQQDQPAVYIYRQEFHEGHVFEGLILGISVIDYLEGSIKKHELTLTEKESRMAEHITRTGVVGEPVLLSNPDGSYTFNWIEANRPEQVALQFDDNMGITHTIWAVTETEAIEQIRVKFRDTEALYIADGHHRIAASSLYLTHMHSEKNWVGEKLCFMAYVLPESALWIKPFHRIVRSIGDSVVSYMLDNCADRFHIEASMSPVIPANKGEFGLCTRKGWYRLRFREDSQYHSPAENLDVSRLEKYIFAGLLGLRDSKSDPRLSFMRGDMPARELETIINSGTADAAFVLNPNTMQEIKMVADAGQTMPPKSTWIEPKLLTGMLIQKF